MSSLEETFNTKFRTLLTKLKTNNLIPQSDTTACVFVHLKRHNDYVTISQLRLLVITYFIAKYKKKKYKFIICLVNWLLKERCYCLLINCLRFRQDFISIMICYFLNNG